MVYTELTVRAMCLAYRLHDGQFDKGGAPYIHHPLFVAEQMTGEMETIAALLHDTMEDCGVTSEVLLAEGFPPSAVEAVVLLTKKDGEDYGQYLLRIKDNPIARAVKIADIRHNSMPERLLHTPEAQDIARLEKYAAALRVLEGE